MTQKRDLFNLSLLGGGPAQAEAKSGMVKLMIERDGTASTVEAKVPVIGSAAHKPESGSQRSLILARCPDGSIQMRPWHESLRMQSNSDVSMGQVWSTASWAIVLGAASSKSRPGGLPGWCAKNVR